MSSLNLKTLKVFSPGLLHIKDVVSTFMISQQCSTDKSGELASFIDYFVKFLAMNYIYIHLWFILLFPRYIHEEGRLPAMPRRKRRIWTPKALAFTCTKPIGRQNVHNFQIAYCIFQSWHYTRPSQTHI